MKAIFVDVDGVICTERSLNIALEKDQEIYNMEFDARTLKYLKKLMEKTGAELVLSSSWRDGIGSDDPETKAIMDNLFSRMAENGTPLTWWTPLIYMGGRDDEVAAWLEEHPCEAYVIFDDNEYFRGSPEIERHFVYIEDSQGIDLWDYLKALRILEGHLPPRRS